MNIEQTIEDNKALVKDIARKFYFKNSIFSVEDLEQVGYLSLWKNLKKYDPNRAKLSTFMTICVRHDMIKFIRKQNIGKSIPPKVQSYMQDTSLFDIMGDGGIEDQIISLKSDNLSTREIAETLNIPQSTVRKTINRLKKTYEEKSSISDRS